MMILITCQAACHGKTEHGIFVKFKSVMMILITCQAACHGKTEHGIFVKFKSVMMILITCQAACHGKTEHGIFVKFKKPSKTAVVLIAGVMAYLSSLKNRAKLLLSSLPVSSLKNRAKLLLSSLPVSPSRVLRAPGTSSYHLVPKHLRATWPRPEQSKLLLSSLPVSSLKNRAKLLLSSLPVSPSRVLRAPGTSLYTIWCRSTFGPRGPGLSNPTSFLRPALPMAPTTDNNARDERSVLRPNPATLLRDFTLYMTTNYAII